MAHTVAVGSGTDALHLGLAGLGIGPGDEVITSPFTFAATVEAIEYVGAQAVLVDIDAVSYNIDANLLEDAITPKTRAVMPVHMFGLPADMRRIVDIAERHDILVIEDCAQSSITRMSMLSGDPFSQIMSTSRMPASGSPMAVSRM